VLEIPEIEHVEGVEDHSDHAQVEHRDAEEAKVAKQKKYAVPEALLYHMLVVQARLPRSPALVKMCCVESECFSSWYPCVAIGVIVDFKAHRSAELLRVVCQ
jgi:hypothetical protein